MGLRLFSACLAASPPQSSGKKLFTILSPLHLKFTLSGLLHSGLFIVHKVGEHFSSMANKCTVCGRAVAGHIKLGCPAGPGNCTLQPLPGHRSAGGSTSMEDINVSDQVATSDNMTTTSEPVSVTVTPPISTTASTSVSSETPSTSSGEDAILTNEQLEAHLTDNIAKLEGLLQKEESEAKAKRVENIQKLYEKEKALQLRLQQVLDAKASVASVIAPPSTPASDPPIVNPFSLPPVTSAGAASSFGALARLRPSSHASSQSSLPTSFFSQSAITTNTTGASMPDIRVASCAPTGLSFSTTRIAQPASLPAAQPLAHAQSLPNVNVNMAAYNPTLQPFITPDDIYQANPIARAMLGLQADARDDAQKLGKYVPELYSLRYGKIEEIRHKMSYSEFMYMYTRMLTFMLKEDPHLVPDRILFLNNVCSKAAKFRWSDVRNCYCVALTEIKRGYRTWGDDWKELTEEYLDSAPKFRQPQASQGPRHYAQSGKTVFTPGKPPCNDFNDSECRRSVCKFDHRCRVCSEDHAAKLCPTQTGGPTGRPVNS